MRNTVQCFFFFFSNLVLLKNRSRSRFLSCLKQMAMGNGHEFELSQEHGSKSPMFRLRFRVNPVNSVFLENKKKPIQYILTPFLPITTKKKSTKINFSKRDLRFLFKITKNQNFFTFLPSRCRDGELSFLDF